MSPQSKNIHIDLRLPRGWNQCATEQLEMIAATIMRHTLRQDRYHPFDWLRVKTELFFLLTETHPLPAETHPLPLPARGGSSYPASTDEEQQPLMVAFNDRRPWWKKVITPSHTGEGRGRGPFPLHAWQVHSFIDQHLKWLDDEKAQPLIVFPYKRLFREWRWQWRWPFIKKHYLAPGELLQDFSWEQYRHLQDYMELFVRQQNQILKLQQTAVGAPVPAAAKAPVPDGSPSGKLAALQREAQATRNRFLAVLFKLGDNRQSAITKKVTDVRWQVILFWWSGLMRYLQKEYPHCFKSSGGKKGKTPANPLQLYVNITATMQKYLQLDEDKVNRQTFHLTLEALERMAKEAEEMERISKKHGK